MLTSFANGSNIYEKMLRGRRCFMRYVSIQEIAEKWKISKRRIQVLCTAGRIRGAEQVGHMWIIPANAVKPPDGRKKMRVSESGRAKDGRILLKKMIQGAFSACSKERLDARMAEQQTITALSVALLRKYMPCTDFTQAYGIIISTLHISPLANDRLLEKLYVMAENLVNDPRAEVDNLISWASQYTGKYLEKTHLQKTQFFTDQYMVDFFIQEITEIGAARKIVDPCCGGGNFLASSLELLVRTRVCASAEEIIAVSERLYGYDVDPAMVATSLVNIRLRAIKLLAEAGWADVSLWDKICPHLWTPDQESLIGALALEDINATDLLRHTRGSLREALGNADIILTNPPFATTKGMDMQLKNFLKEHYPLSNADMCAAFFQVIHSLLKTSGICGIVSQTSWMHLESFRTFRKDYAERYSVRRIANLGTGAFQDLSGEKTNVALLIITKDGQQGDFAYADLRSLDYQKKVKALRTSTLWNTMKGAAVFKRDGSHFDFDMTGGLKDILQKSRAYGEYAAPMQGTSTGNAKELIDYYWNHIGDPAWIPVSKGGGYCRWQGLNRYVVKWGREGEYIKSTHGAVLRNTKYFAQTEMVFSDTGTGGLNVRILLPHQIFVASGPGIRRRKGSLYAHIAYLNSRIASCYLKASSPKLTISAGYIARLPVTDALMGSKFLEKNVRRCIEQKKNFLRKRAVNLEYDAGCLDSYQGDIHKIAQDWFLEEVQGELLRLCLEAQMDREIQRLLHISAEERAHLSRMVGDCAADIQDERILDNAELDALIAGNLDERGQLKRSRVDKQSMGCDGVLEFIARSLRVRPGYLAQQIRDHIDALPQTLFVFEKMVMHGLVLKEQGYSVQTGAAEALADHVLIVRLKKKYVLDDTQLEWYRNEFAAYHKAYFYGAGFLHNFEEKG